jgi:uncharacterized protein
MGDDGWKEMPAQISLESADQIALALRSYLDKKQKPLAIVLHGGEPLLLGKEKLKQILQIFRCQLPAECSIGIQTNGILLSDEILDVCAELRATISVSIDGPKHIHDQDRIGHNGNGTFDQVIDGIQLLKNHSDSDFLFSGLLTVINSESDPVEIYSFLKSFDPPGVDFLYRDGNHSCLPVGKASLNSTEFGEWFIALFDHYLSDPQPMRIRFLDDLIKLTLGGKGTKDGAGLTDFGFLVFETDGSVSKNDTLKSSFNGADKFQQKWSAETHSIGEILGSKEYQEYHQNQRPTSKICQNCPELDVCGGGMTLHRWQDENGYDNPSVYCEDQKLLIGHIQRQLSKIQENLQTFAS